MADIQFALQTENPIPSHTTGGETGFFRLFTSHAKRFPYFFSYLLLFPINISCTSEAKQQLAC